MSNSKLSTSGFLTRLFKTANLKQFIARNGDEFTDETFSDYINQLCGESNLSPSEVVKKTGIERTYGLQIFRGIRNPSRDKVILLAFGFGLDADGAQSLLRAAGKNALYPKIKRDAVILYCLEKKKTVVETQDMIYDLKLPLLGGDCS